MLDWLKTLLLFFYGTTPAAVSHHTPQAKMVAMTLGGILAFVTVPFVLAGTAFLVGSATPEGSNPGYRWMVIIAITCLLTLAIVWVERALVILGDAVDGSWLSQGILFGVRLAMILLFSVVIAHKWEMAAHRGLIRAELQAMGDEAIERHERYSTREFNVDGLKGGMDAAESRLREVETSLARLPADLTFEVNRARECEFEAVRLKSELSALERIDLLKAEQAERLSALQALSPVKSAECRQLAINARRRVHDYETPLRRELARLQVDLPKLSRAHAEAATKARTVFRERVGESRQALGESGSDEKAFVRVRQGNPEIDRAVKQKTLMLAAIELLPLLLKMLLRNSPIAAEARAKLQEESASYRLRERHSLAVERAHRGWTAPIGSAHASSAKGSPLTRSASISRSVEPCPASERTTDGHWIGHPN